MRGDKLQEIIELLPYSIRYSGEIEELLDYAKEQAERVQELEEHIDYIYDNNVHLKGDYRLQEQNKRYREALKNIYELAEYNEYDNTLEQIVSEVEKALKGE